MRRNVPLWLIPFLVGMSIFGLTFLPGAATANEAASTFKVGVQAASKLYLPLIAQNYDPSKTWLLRVNAYRAQAKLPALTENTDWSFGAGKHATYLINVEPDASEFAGESQTQGGQWYSQEGDDAARNSLMIGAVNPLFTDDLALDFWMRSPFQALSILDPELRQTSFGSARDASGTIQMAAVLDVRRGWVSGPPASVTYPVMWPGNGQVISLRTYSGSDAPNPFDFQNCNSPGFDPAKAGLPLLLQVGSGSASGPTVNRGANPSILSQNGIPQPHCLITASDMTPQYQNLLAARDALILIPQNPLVAGAAYSAAITATLSGAGSPSLYQWSFSVSPGAP